MSTLLDTKKRLYFSALNISSVQAEKILGKIPDFIQSHGRVLPDSAAIEFYLMNHGWGLVSVSGCDYSPLGKYEEFVEEYIESQSTESIRMFYYLLMICTRECRHMKQDSKKSALFTKYSELHTFFSHYVNDTSSMDQIKKTCEMVPTTITMGVYTDWLVDAFSCSYSPGYGGSAWKKVAVCLQAFVHGKISAEAMMDTAYTLAHNNGPIFNKGMLYENYTGNFLKILDIQAAGQIPQYVYTEPSDAAQKSVGTVHKLVDLFPALGAPVDWKLVNAVSKTGPHKPMKIKSKKPTSNTESLDAIIAVWDKKEQPVGNWLTVGFGDSGPIKYEIVERAKA